MLYVHPGSSAAPLPRAGSRSPLSWPHSLSLSTIKWPPSAMGISLPKCQFLSNQAGTGVIAARCHLNANEQAQALSINQAQNIPLDILNTFLGLTRLYSTSVYDLLHDGA